MVSDDDVRTVVEEIPYCQKTTMLLHRIAPLLLLSMSLIACRSPEMAEVDPRSQQNHGTDPGAGTEMFTDPTQFASPTGGGDGGRNGGRAPDVRPVESGAGSFDENPEIPF